MFCNQCGARNDDDARFCGSCGRQFIKPVVAVGESSSHASFNDTLEDEEEREEKKSDLVDKRLGKKEGEWLERYVQQILDTAGFRTERDQRVKLASQGKSTHEIDIWATAPEGTVLVECKDYSEHKVKKEMFDAFVGKMHDRRASAGIFVISHFTSEDYSAYKEYLLRHRTRFWDAQVMDNIWQEFLKTHDVQQFHSYICMLLGLIRIDEKKHSGFGAWFSKIFSEKDEGADPSLPMMPIPQENSHSFTKRVQECETCELGGYHAPIRQTEEEARRLAHNIRQKGGRVVKIVRMRQKGLLTTKVYYKVIWKHAPPMG